MADIATNIGIDIDDSMFDESGQFKDIDQALSRYENSVQLLAHEFCALLGDD